MELAIGTLLRGETYRIERTLGQGGFGITYLAEQVMLGRKVAVKEFFMKELCERNESTSHVTLGTEGSRETVNRFREKFLKEARNIARLNHPNIIKIIDVFEENNTAYYVMDYAEGGSLSDIIKRHGCLSESVATKYILDVARALNCIHQHKMTHLDIKPANIMVDETNKAVLIDFGLSKQYTQSGEQTSKTPIGISEGYAPLEQYNEGGMEAFSPETDSYALGATFFKLLTGITPPHASIVNEIGIDSDELYKKGVSQTIVELIVNLMKPKRCDRIIDIKDVIMILEQNISNTSSSDEENTIVPGVREPNTGEKQATDSPVAKESQTNHDTSKFGINNKGVIFVLVIAGVLSVWGISKLSNNAQTQSENIAEGRSISLTLCDGTVISWSGNVKNNQPEGKGTAVYQANDKDGRERYVGSFVDGKRQDSNATLYYTNGDTYVGSFEYDHFVSGRLTHASDGLYYEGAFINDKEYYGFWKFSSDNSVYSSVENGKEYIK